MSNMEKQVHPIPPVYNSESKILILGSFPSVRSREERFFYAHPQNRFWKVIAAVLGIETPLTIEEKREMLLENNIALWDVIKSCEIEGSSDSTIKNVTVNDFSEILTAADIKMIFANGSTAFKMFKKYSGIEKNILKLPSSSPANAVFTTERLIKEWSIILDYIKEPLN